MENDGEIDDMSYLELDEEEEYDLICKFENYYMKHIGKKEKKKKDSKLLHDINVPRDKEKHEKEKNVKPKRSFVRSKFIPPKNCDSKNETIPTLYYY